MTPEQLAAIEARDRARTPGEWTWEDDSCIKPGMATVYAGRTNEWHGLNLFGRIYPDANGAANLDWLAACSVDVPALCAALRAAWAEVERLRARNAILEDRLEEWGR